jgi:type IV pilus secretin PilQ/predicted competence protein
MQVAAANQGRGAEQAQPAAPARPPSSPAAQPGARDRGAAPRPAAANAEQQIQFDKNGLVTMHVNELDVRQLLELLSRRSGLNILVSPKVSGTITANFENTSVEQVLKSVIKLANLVEKKEGTIHYLYSKGEIDDDAEFIKREEIMTRVYRLNYVRSDELLAMIRPFLSVEVGQKRVSVTPSYRFGIGESATFVSGGVGAAGGGTSTANTGGPTNQGASGGGSTVGGYQPPTGGNSMSDSDMLIVQDFESNLKIVDQIVLKVDTRPVQVLIEAVIISVDLEHARQLGVNFALVDNLGNALGEIGSGASLNSNVGFNPTQLLTAAGKIAGSATDPTGLVSPLNGAKFGFVANNVTGFIQALETIGSTKILASPRILVLNKQRAEIQLGSRLGFQTFSQNFTSTIQQVQFLNVGTLLRIRPFISQDGMIRMEIHPERSSGTVSNNIPNQQTAELTTNVMVPDGATLVIGGLMEDEDDFQLQGLPGLSRIPALGYLFGFRQKTDARRELVVLLTPHIWSPEQGMPHTVDPTLGPQDMGPRSPAEHGSIRNSPDPSVPAVAPLPDGASSGASPGVNNAEVTLVENKLAPSSTRASTTPARVMNAQPATLAEQVRQGAPARRKGVLGSFMERITRRGDSQDRDQGRPGEGQTGPNTVRDASLGFTKPNAPRAAGAPAMSPAPAAAQRESKPQSVSREPITQSSWAAASRRTSALRDDRVLRTSTFATTETPPAAASRPHSNIRRDSPADRPSRSGSERTSPKSPDAGWMPAQPTRSAPEAGWVPATRSRGAKSQSPAPAATRSVDESSDQFSGPRPSDDN